MGNGIPVCGMQLLSKIYSRYFVLKNPGKNPGFTTRPLLAFFLSKNLQETKSWPDWYRATTSLQFKGHCFLKTAPKKFRTNKERKKWRGLQGISSPTPTLVLWWSLLNRRTYREWGWYPIHLLLKIASGASYFYYFRVITVIFDAKFRYATGSSNILSELVYSIYALY